MPSRDSSMSGHLLMETYEEEINEYHPYEEERYFNNQNGSKVNRNHLKPKSTSNQGKFSILRRPNTEILIGSRTGSQAIQFGIPKERTPFTTTSSHHNQQQHSWEQMSYQLMNKEGIPNSDSYSGGVASGGSSGGARNGVATGGHHHLHNYRQPSVATVNFFEMLVEAQETSTNLADLMAKTMHAVAIGFPCTILLGAVTVLAIAMIAFGGSNYYKCPASDWLPIWLIVTGILLMFYCILLIRTVGKLRQEESGELLEDFDLASNSSSKKFVWALSALQLLIFCVGNYLVFSIYYPHTEIPQIPPFVYCAEALYNFSLFWIVLVYIFFISIIACILCVVKLYYKNSTRYMNFHCNSYNRI